MSTLSLPAGFIEQKTGDLVWWVKVGWESTFPTPYSSLLTPHSSHVITRGRGTIQRIQINPQEAIIVRPYRRGGIVRHVVHDLYWDRPPRPFVELTCTEEARQRGVPTVEVLGACVEWTLGVLYRGWLITREASGFHTLWEWLQTEKSADLRQQMLAAVAQEVAAMHKAGIVHADLNPTNILVDPTSDSPQVLLIDFDRARLFPQIVSAALREVNLRRLRRFFKKHDAREERLSPADFEHLLQAYRAALSA